MQGTLWSMRVWLARLGGGKRELWCTRPETWLVIMVEAFNTGAIKLEVFIIAAKY